MSNIVQTLDEVVGLLDEVLLLNVAIFLAALGFLFLYKK